MSATSGIPNGLYGYKTTVLSNNSLDADKLIGRDWNASLIKGFICQQHQIRDAGQPRRTCLSTTRRVGIKFHLQY